MNFNRLICLLALLSFFSCTAQNQRIGLRKITQLPDALRESSGLAVAGSNLVWSHEDSGNDNKLYGFDTLGSLKRTLVIGNVENIDWEDLTTDDDGNIYIADLGNNNNNRLDLAIYRIPNPENFSGSQVQANILQISYADQAAFPPPSYNHNFDVEAIVWRSGFLYLFTKDRSQPFSGLTKMYKVNDDPGTYYVQPDDSYFVGSDTDNDRITSADYNRSTGELVLLTHNRLISFTNYQDDHFFDGTIVEYYFEEEPGQNEAIGFVDARNLYMTEEGSGGESGFLYQLQLPRLSAGNQDLNTQTHLTISPNPSTGFVSIKSAAALQTPVTITDSFGKVVCNFHLTTNHQLDISQFKAGVYYLTLPIGKKSLTKRFVKQ